MAKEYTPENLMSEEFGHTFFDVPTALSILQSPTPSSLIEKKQAGGQTLDYVSAATVIRTLNKAFGLRWSFRIHESRYVESYKHGNNEQRPVVQTLGELTVPGLGSRMQWGSQSVVGGQQQQEHAFKGSASDALKKCAAMFLVHLDLADKGPKTELGIGPENLPAFDLEKMQKQQQATPEQPAEEPVSAPVEKTPVQAPQAQQGSEERIQEEPQIPQAVQESINTVPEVQPSASNPEPVQPTQPVQQNANQWSKEDVEELKNHKDRLKITTNEELNPYIQTFFGNDEMTFRQLTPVTIKDFNHYLSGQ